MKNSEDLDLLFHPQTIAIAGVSEKTNKFNFGLKYLEGLTQFGFPGKIYPVNHRRRSPRHDHLQKR